MGTSGLRQLLRSLCHNTVWNYAVLWKLIIHDYHQSPMILIWEDGYLSFSKPGQSLEAASGDVYYKVENDILSLPCSEENSLGLMAADMAGLQYVFGEGVVGKVAEVGDYCWVSVNDIFTDELELIPECPQEWLLQFASGIKTILLLPVLPLGVLQLGSLEEVAKDVSMVKYVKSRFDYLHSIAENTAAHSLNKDFQVRLFSPISSSPTGYSSAPSASGLPSVKTEDTEQLIAAEIPGLGSDGMRTASQIQGAFAADEGYIPKTCILERDKVGFPLPEIPSPSESLNAYQLELAENKLFEISYLTKELQGYSDCNDYNVGVSNSFNQKMNFYPLRDLLDEPYEGKNAFNGDHSIISSFRFPKHSELHTVLDPRKWPNSSLLADYTYSTSSLLEEAERSWFAREGEAGYLLDDIVASVNSTTLDDVTSDNSGSLKSSTDFSSCSIATLQTKHQCNARSLGKNDFILQSHLQSACITQRENADNGTSDSSRGTMHTDRKVKNEREADNKEPTGGQKRINSSKRRAGQPGENQRPRPRDRQLIQDRVKELRELVPNGAKCSIDSLLDQTIKHMMYLRSIADQAEKLKQCARQEIRSSTETKENCQSGASWALEYGSESQACPIAVKDLSLPGHMLIEMICNEQSLFLEIAQVIRGLELNILKGVLESRSSNTWARFVVEACNGFHRLHIFWPLMQLLQRKRKSISSKI